jgi:DNA-binding transcriptional ArsR family regulator
VDSFEAIFDIEQPVSSALPAQGDLLQASRDDVSDSMPMTDLKIERDVVLGTPAEPTAIQISEVKTDSAKDVLQADPSPADEFFAAVRKQIRQLLSKPMKDKEIAESLDVEPKQVKVWLQRLVEEGVLEKQKKPVCYIVKQPMLYQR